MLLKSVAVLHEVDIGEIRLLMLAASMPHSAACPPSKHHA